jgi:hypothetical protein
MALLAGDSRVVGDPACPIPILPSVQAGRTRSAAGLAETAATVGSSAERMGTPAEAAEPLVSDPSEDSVRSEGARMAEVALAYRAFLGPWEVPNSAAQLVAQTTADLQERGAAGEWDCPA